MISYNIFLIISKMIRNIIALFIFNKKSRKNFRIEFNKLIAPTALKLLKRFVKKQYEDYWVFVPFWPWGDFLIGCSLLKEFKREHGGKILIFYANDAQLKFINALGVADKVVKMPSEIYYTLGVRTKFIPHNPDGLKKGHIYEISHMSFNEAEENKSSNFAELYAKMLDIKEIRFAKPSVPQDIKENVQKEFDRISGGKKVIMLTPHAKSYNEMEISSYFWLNLAKQLEQQGFKVVFNSKREVYSNFESVFLPLFEQAYFASLCYGNITIRSGFTDVITIMGTTNQIVLYPESMRFITITEEAQLKEMSRIFKRNTDLSFAENMYSWTSINNMFNTTFLELVIEYKNKFENIFNYYNYNEGKKDGKCERIA